MKDFSRITIILTDIEVFWKMNPELRLGQVISMVASKQRIKDLFYMTDEDFTLGLEQLQEEQEKRKL